AGEPKLDAGV
uniref:Pneumadin n=1 Tax=Homo sapiens TaxID=9606 RepID=PNEU_HUMAN|nr:RecName: Full=Pneumadin; Short=PNM [Homo sapiens]